MPSEELAGARISFAPRPLIFALCGLVALIVVLGIARMFAVHALEAPANHVVMRWFDLNGEQSLPAWLSSTMLAFAAMLALLCARRPPAGLAAYWAVLAAGLLLMSADETIQIHERFSLLLPGGKGTYTGFLSYAWVVVAIPLVVLIGLIFVPFFARLPGDTRWRPMLAGAVYLGGAIGMEMLGAANRPPEALVLHNVFIVLEESGEMLGILLLLHAWRGT